MGRGDYVTGRFHRVASERHGDALTLVSAACVKGGTLVARMICAFFFFSRPRRSHHSAVPLVLLQRSKGQIGEVKNDQGEEEQGGEAYFDSLCLDRKYQLEAGTHDGTKVLVCERNLTA